MRGVRFCDLTVREPTLPVEPATNTTSLSFELISCLVAADVLGSVDPDDAFTDAMEEIWERDDIRYDTCNSKQGSKYAPRRFSMTKLCAISKTSV